MVFTKLNWTNQELTLLDQDFCSLPSCHLARAIASLPAFCLSCIYGWEVAKLVCVCVCVRKTADHLPEICCKMGSGKPCAKKKNILVSWIFSTQLKSSYFPSCLWAEKKPSLLQKAKLKGRAGLFVLWQTFCLLGFVSTDTNCWLHLWVFISSVQVVFALAVWEGWQDPGSGAGWLWVLLGQGWGSGVPSWVRAQTCSAGLGTGVKQGSTCV